LVFVALLIARKKRAYINVMDHFDALQLVFSYERPASRRLKRPAARALYRVWVLISEDELPAEFTS
jgi:hypothetical protein